MGTNPINLAVRFVLEIGALLALGGWGWNQSDGILKYVLALGLPILVAAVWGTFAVPGDPSRSGKAPVRVPGLVRLLIELAFFSGAAWALFSIGAVTPGWIFAIVALIHYALSYDRIQWLIRH